MPAPGRLSKHADAHKSLGYWIKIQPLPQWRGQLAGAPGRSVFHPRQVWGAACQKRANPSPALGVKGPPQPVPTWSSACHRSSGITVTPGWSPTHSSAPPDRAGPPCRMFQHSPRLGHGPTLREEHPEPSRQVSLLGVKVASVLQSSPSGLLRTNAWTDTGHRDCLMPHQATPRHNGSQDPTRAVTLPQQ